MPITGKVLSSIWRYLIIFCIVYVILTIALVQIWKGGSGVIKEWTNHNFDLRTRLRASYSFRTRNDFNNTWKTGDGVENANASNISLATQWPTRKDITKETAKTLQISKLQTGSTIADSREIQTPQWQKRLHQTSKNKSSSYFLTVALQVRIYEDDKARWTLRELKQWMHYVFLAGVEHIYLCDHYKYIYEMLDKKLESYIKFGLVTYIPWNTPREAMTAQIKCYQHIIDISRGHATWQTAIDMDEYPFSFRDTNDGFLARYLRTITKRVSEISMKNYLMLGQGDRTRNLVIDRITRMTPKPANNLVKPIYKPDKVTAGLHHNFVRRGSTMYAHDMEMRMLHYWGARLQNWGADTPRTLRRTVTMNLMRDVMSPRVRDSLLAFGETDAFATDTGP